MKNIWVPVSILFFRLVHPLNFFSIRECKCLEARLEARGCCTIYAEATSMLLSGDKTNWVKLIERFPPLRFANKYICAFMSYLRAICRAYLMEEREAEKTLNLFGRLSWHPLSLSRSRTHPDEEAVETLLGPLSWTPRQAKTLTKASVLKFGEPWCWPIHGNVWKSNLKGK